MIFLIIRYTGARLSEVLHLDPFKDIDFEKHAVYLCKTTTSSSSECREVQIPEPLSHEIRHLLAEHQNGSLRESIFKVDPAHVRRKFYEMAESSGIPRESGSPDMLRKSRAVELMKNNVPLPVVQKILGHSTPNLAASYVEFSNEEIQRVARMFADRESRQKTSARNIFFGRIDVIGRGDVQTMVEIVSIGGHRIHSVITSQSLDRLGLKPGSMVAAEIKAPWVEIHGGDSDPNCSSENRFRGTIQRIRKGKITSEVVMELADGTELCALLTQRACRQMNLREQDSLWAAFSAFSVILHVD
jgi:molybdate transport system regulatory protein